MTAINTPSSRCRFGIGRRDITPPVGIYHRFWGAADHDRAEGVHRPLLATVLLTAPLEEAATDATDVLIALDHCILRPPEMQELSAAVCELIGIPASRVTFTFSHTHSGGNLCRDRTEMPGGDLIVPYLESLPAQIAAAYHEAAGGMQPVTLTYAATESAMGQHRDFWDEQQRRYVCGLNPQGQNDRTVLAVRATTDSGETLATIVNYGCHPTTLAWENRLISPDYVGALRDTVESQTHAPCLFLLSPCGDIGPRNGFVGDQQIADQNGRQVGYAVLAALEGMPPSGHDHHYGGPVLSGATLGVWEYRPFSPSRDEAAARYRSRRWSVPLDYLDELPTVEQINSNLTELLEQESLAADAGEAERAHEFRVLAERQRRLLERIEPLPAESRYPFAVEVAQRGDAFWITVEGEPYNLLAQQLRGRFPDHPLVISVLCDGARAGYLPRREDYGLPLYQAEIAVLAAGGLETVIEEISRQIAAWIDDRVDSP